MEWMRVKRRIDDCSSFFSKLFYKDSIYCVVCLKKGYNNNRSKIVLFMVEGFDGLRCTYFGWRVNRMCSGL